MSRDGRRFLAGYAPQEVPLGDANDEAQYQALMEAGVTFATAWSLIPGVALSAEQMARLTSDIVWLVEKEVAGQKVLVPQLYARLRDGDLAPSGALLAGTEVSFDTAAELINSGRIAGRHVVSKRGQTTVSAKRGQTTVSAAYFEDYTFYQPESVRICHKSIATY